MKYRKRKKREREIANRKDKGEIINYFDSTNLYVHVMRNKKIFIVSTSTLNVLRFRHRSSLGLVYAINATVEAKMPVKISVSVHAVYWWKELSRDGAGARGIRLSPL